MKSTYRRGSLALALASLTFALPASCTATEPNQTWQNSTVLAPNVRFVDDTIFSAGQLPSFDTTLAAFGNRDVPLRTDDDGSPLGNGLASALFDVPIGGRAIVRVAVSGFPDFDFNASTSTHTQSGTYDLYINIFNRDGDVIEEIFETDVLEPGQVDFFEFMNEEWIGGSYEAIVDNLSRASGYEPDIDFFTFTGLPAGAPFIAEITSGEFDTVLGWLDDAGEILAVDDDAGANVLSRLQGVTPEGGEVHLAVSGYSDFNFVGAHSQSGPYRLELTIVPEPTGLALIVLAAGALGLAASGGGAGSRSVGLGRS